MILSEGENLYYSYGGIKKTERARVNLTFTAKGFCIKGTSENPCHKMSRIEQLYCKSETEASE